MRNNKIDFLKGIAMLAIVLLHSIQVIEGFPAILKTPLLLGQVGVQGFFVCSGFLVANSYFKEEKHSFERHSRFMLKKYISLAIPFAISLAGYLLANAGFHLLGIAAPYANNTQSISVGLNLLLLHGLSPFCYNNVVPGGWYVGTLFLLFLLCPAFQFLSARQHKAKDSENRINKHGLYIYI